MAIIFDRVPGDLPSSVTFAAFPRVTATMAVGNMTASSTELPRVLAIIVWPETSARGPCPV
jgi:hypothetical protein